MAHGEAKVVIRRPAKEVLDFVMDLHEYRKIDKKLGVIRWLRRDGDTVTFRFRPWLLGLPGPMTTQRLVRTGDSRIDISPPGPSWQDRLADKRHRIRRGTITEGISERLSARLAFQIRIQQAVKEMLARFAPHRQSSSFIRLRTQSSLH